MGPYRVAVQQRAADTMHDRRSDGCIHLEARRIELRRGLQGAALARAFFYCLIKLGHYSHGCQQGCVEEAYAQSMATTLIEFAQRNGTAWRWFDRLVAPPRLGQAPRRGKQRMPAQVLVRGRPVALARLSHAQTGGAFGWYDHRHRRVGLFDGIDGRQLAIVAAHELTHAIHAAYGLRKHDRHARFRGAELKGWLGLIRDDPQAWRWLASLAR